MQKQNTVRWKNDQDLKIPECLNSIILPQISYTDVWINLLLSKSGNGLSRYYILKVLNFLDISFRSQSWTH